MFVIEVIPLKRGMHLESLSYFSSESYESGTLLTIPIRNKPARGVVTGSAPVGAAKAALRAATFSLKKLPPQEHVSTLAPTTIATANELTQYYACQPGAALWGLLLPEVRDGTHHLPHTRHVTPHEVHPPEVLQDTSDERYLAYTSLVRGGLAHSESILIVVPSPIEADIAREHLSRGIEDRVVVLHSSLGVASRRSSYAALEDFSKPKLIIATPPYAVLERHDISTIILEGERSGNYRSRTRPYFDYRVVLRIHARHTGRRLIYGDLLVRTEEEALRREETYETFGEAQRRLALSGKLLVVRMKEKPDAGTPFRLFSSKIIDAIRKAHEEKKRCFLFAARRGLAPVVTCIDCGHVFRSPDTGAPYSLVRTTRDGKESRWFVCGVSGRRVRAADVCPICGSWRLRTRGIGIQHAYDELTKELPGVPIITFDQESANTYKKASFLRKKFYETKGAVMLGTQMALPYLTEPMSMSVVVSMDALRATPTWHQEEVTLFTLLALREHTAGAVYVQMRTIASANEKDPFIEYARSGMLEKFYDEEIALRRKYKYPPFSHFVHLTWQGSTNAAAETERIVHMTLEFFDVHYYSAPPSQKGTRIRYGLIRLPRENWPNIALVEALRQLPPSVRIIMNPDRIV